MIKVSEGTGKHRIEAKVFSTEEGLILHMLGGEKPHVGAVVISIPRESLRGDGSLSCTTSCLPFLGHKDDVAVKPLAEKLAILTRQKVVAISGIHVKNATEDDLKIIQSNISLISHGILNEF